MEIKMMKGHPKTVRVALGVTFAELARAEKFSAQSLTCVDPETKKVTYRIMTDADGVKSYALGVKAASATPAQEVVIIAPQGDLDKDDLGVIATKLTTIIASVKEAVSKVEAAAKTVVEEE